jgi:hypothetical protein
MKEKITISDVLIDKEATWALYTYQPKVTVCPQKIVVPFYFNLKHLTYGASSQSSY